MPGNPHHRGHPGPMQGFDMPSKTWFSLIGIRQIYFHLDINFFITLLDRHHNIYGNN